MSQNGSITASDIITQVDIDKGYLSRILKKFEKNGLINRVGSGTDKRAVTLELSAKGKKAYEMLNKASDKQTASLFDHLTAIESDELIQKVKEIQALLKKGLQNE